MLVVWRSKASAYTYFLDLSDEARILYSSDSIVDILGHTPDEVVNRSCWEFFHSDEVPLARRLHSRGVYMDKSTVLAYCRLINRRGDWVTCECCFSIVYDVMVVCTSIYRSAVASQSMYSNVQLRICVDAVHRTGCRSTNYPPTVFVLTPGPALSHVVISFSQVQAGC
jgi:PAS domain S-box-containing protein